MNVPVALRTHVRGLSAEHDLTEKIVRAMIGLGHLPAGGELPSAEHKRPEETLLDFGFRMLATAGAVTTREQCGQLRSSLAAMRILTAVTIPYDRVLDVSRILDAEGASLDSNSLFAIIGGNCRQSIQLLERARSQMSKGQNLTAKDTLDIDDHHLAALVRNGFIDELRQGSPVQGQPIDFASLRHRITAAFRAWEPERLDLQGIKDVAIIRTGLRSGTLEHFAEGILSAGVELLQRSGVEATAYELDALFGGDIGQHRAYLTKRARTKRDVALPPRTTKGVWSLNDLACLPSPVDKLYDTALDPERGSSRDKVGRADIGRIATNPHPQLRIVGAVVTLHGARKKAVRFRATWASNAASNLAGPLAGIDITNGAQLATGFAAMRMVAKGFTDRHDVQRSNRDIDCWRHVIHVYDDYLARADLPPALRSILIENRPAHPSGGSDLFSLVRGEMNEFDEHSRNLRDKDLQPYLANVPGFLRQVMDAHEQLEAMRNDIKSKVAAAEGKETSGILSKPIDDTFCAEVLLPDGEVASVAYSYTVHPWTTIIAQVPRPPKMDKRSPRSPLDPSNPAMATSPLFENRYAVELKGCTCKGETVDYPLAILRLHRDFGFWTPLDCSDQAAFELRCERLLEFGVTTVSLYQSGKSIANFEGVKFRWAKRIRQQLGVFLFPFEEAYHSSLIGALQVVTRSVEALRTGDLMQWNVGTGLETGLDADGNPFSVLASIPKKKITPRKTPLNSQCEDLTEKLLELASERFFGGDPIPHLRRSKYNGKGPEMESLVFAGQIGGLTNGAMNANCRLLMVGNGVFKTHYMKYVWSKLSRSAGQTLEQRREGHGHETVKTAMDYDVLTPDERDEQLRLRRDQAELRGRWLRGEVASPVPEQSMEDLRFERRRLLHEIDFLRSEKAGSKLDKASAQLKLIEAKIARATDATA